MKFTNELNRVAGNGAIETIKRNARIGNVAAFSQKWSLRGVGNCWILFDCVEDAINAGAMAGDRLTESGWVSLDKLFREIFNQSQYGMYEPDPLPTIEESRREADMLLIKSMEGIEEIPLNCGDFEGMADAMEYFDGKIVNFDRVRKVVVVLATAEEINNFLTM